MGVHVLNCGVGLNSALWCQVPQETVDAIEVTNVCEQLYDPQEHKAEFLEEIRDTMSV